ncbi:hypothetical protein [Aminivibrio sp.]|uniref:hypothetical protein n=1 Tax=Aminivibrio sp. TaxID=1872489 RepID=UPI001A40E824|nr:hypothetical protein [Aminivibrio sp.]MBL3539337.1 hypothetical protein [Aminivibrio sp.]MDK2959236.1 hypothetical protein [Synergistaceae bacterium]
MKTVLRRIFEEASARRACRFLVLAGLVACLSAVKPGGSEAVGPPSNEELHRRIAVLEQALSLRNEGRRMEAEGNVPGAMEAYWKSFVLYPDPLLEAQALSFRPDLKPLKDRIASLERLLAAGKTGKEAASPPPAVSTARRDSAGQDKADWRIYPDLGEEKKAIEETFGRFRKALKEGNVEGAVRCVDESRREVFAALFGQKPEAMPSFAELLDGAEMSFLSSPENADPRSKSTMRTSEYAVDVGGFTFYVQWVKVDGQWVLFDF